ALDEGYRYGLVGREKLYGRDCYVLSFEPATTERSLYRGRVYIDTKLFTRVRMDAVQEGLQAPLRSNSLKVTFSPVAAPGGVLWVATSIAGQMSFEIIGQNRVVEREATYGNFVVNDEGFRTRMAESQESGRPMFRETDEGLYRLERSGDEERLVSASTPRNALLGVGINTGFGGSPGFPFAGVNFFDFDFKGTGTQLNLAWAGPFVDLSWRVGNLGHRPPEDRPLSLTLQGSFNGVPRKDKLAQADGTDSGESLEVYQESARAALAIPMGHFAKWTLEGRATWFR